MIYDVQRDMSHPKKANINALPREAIQATIAHKAPMQVPENRANPVVLDAPMVIEQTNM